MNLKEMREKRGELAKRIRELAVLANDEKRTWTQEDENNWVQVNKDYNALVARIQREERALEVEADVQRSAGERSDAELLGDPEDRARASQPPKERSEEQAATRTAERRIRDENLSLQAWLRAPRLDLTEEHRAACGRLGINPRAPEYVIRLDSTERLQRRQAELRAPMGVTAGIGGETVPQGFMAQLERALLFFAGVRQVGRLIRTATGNPMPWPLVNDTGNAGVLLAENTQVAEVDVTTSSITLNAYKFTSRLVLVSAELLQDSAFDLATELASILGERIGRVMNTYQTTGTGTSQPQGVVTGSTLGKTAASATAIASTELFDLLHAVDPAYRREPGFGFMMHDNILLYIRKLQDTTNNFLFQTNMREGQPDTLLGAPIYINAAMQSSVATGTKTVLCGAFGRMLIREVAELRLKRLVERYGDYDQEGFVAFLRMDSRLLNAGTNPVKHLIQA